ncbi:uncharacterized protein LOC115023444 isoform X1 [Cottoperca gobio]|uniref:Uncharacterized protein LOC115023444 isoform X1 n=1 Tax=Cottoperca gobio TaxID=56716 RepID=A0A6J2RLR0_COTGO|nr:uncharacterized protein LOC115023444 isoform X1 [Cottoperca gobio]
MESFPLITAVLLCRLSWISVSVTQTVEVQPGGEVTLLCTNISSHPTQTDWFRQINRTKPSCISSIHRADTEVSFCDGFQNGKFNMSSNTTTVFLKIKEVDSSDSGLYFCGFYIDKHTVMVGAVYVNVQGNDEYVGEVDLKTKEEPDEMANLILGGLAVFLIIVVIVLAARIKNLQRDVNEKLNTERSKNVGSDDLNCAELRFLHKTIRSRRPTSERQLETHVVYAASR